jgi:hypothetical protein
MLLERDSKRFMFSCLPKEVFCNCGCGGRHTVDSILEAFVWDLSMLFGGCRTAARHEKVQWGDQDYLRSKKAGQRDGVHAVLLQARGDWPWHSLFFNVPAHSSNSMRWRCKASKNGDLAYWHTGQHGEWRNHRYAPRGVPQ